MNRTTDVDCEMRTTLPANMAAVEMFFIEFRRRIESILDRSNLFTAELLVREALTNAVMHGCHADPSKQVRCLLRLRVKCRRLLIAVADEGDGFDWRNALRKSAGDCQCSGRGVEIFRLYADRVRYSSRGNLVTIIKRF